MISHKTLDRDRLYSTKGLSAVEVREQSIIDVAYGCTVVKGYQRPYDPHSQT